MMTDNVAQDSVVVAETEHSADTRMRSVEIKDSDMAG